MLKGLNVKMKKNGFTLIEMMIAIFVMVVGMLAIISLLQTGIFSSSISSSRLTASYLAQEGAEIIKNVRDTNWLEARTSQNSWDEGLTVCSGVGFIVDYNHSYGPSQIDPSFPCYSSQYLNIDSSGFYSYSSGVQTKFKRKILITQGSDSNMRNVSVVISWTERGKDYSLTGAENHLNILAP